QHPSLLGESTHMGYFVVLGWCRAPSPGGYPRPSVSRYWEERMDTFECIRTRRTTRTFLPKDLPENTIHRILEAGRLTPSARNRQPWHLIAIRDKALLQRLAPLCTTGQFIEQASFAVAIVTDPANRWHEIDGARAVQNMELAGWNDGVGTCWIGGLARERIKER